LLRRKYPYRNPERTKKAGISMMPACNSPSRIRTYDLAVNSRSLYRLSYRGTRGSDSCESERPRTLYCRDSRCLCQADSSKTLAWSCDTIAKKKVRVLAKPPVPILSLLRDAVRLLFCIANPGRAETAHMIRSSVLDVASRPRWEGVFLGRLFAGSLYLCVAGGSKDFS
jgi:hypothetical protein